MTLVAGTGMTAWTWWSQQPEEWRSTSSLLIDDQLVVWWPSGILGGAGLLSLLLWYWVRRRGRRAVALAKPVQTSGGTPETRNWSTAVSSLAAALTVLVAVAAILYTNAANRQQAQLTEQGQISDRFSRSVEQLGQEDNGGQSRLSVRLGGIYALERLMRDSPRDQLTIVEVLSAFVRTHAHVPNPPVPAAKLPSSPPDVQAAVVVLARRPELEGLLGGIPDLSNSRVSMPSEEVSGDLGGVELVGANLRRADLHGADLSNTTLTKADLAGAWLGNTKLNGAFVSGVNFSGATMDAADLSGTDLSRSLGLTGKQIRCARIDEWTILPPGVDRPVEGAPATNPACFPD